MAESFGAIYERNAINAAFPVLTYSHLSELELINRDKITINLETGYIRNIGSGKQVFVEPFSEVQMQIYKNGGLLKG